MQSLHTRRIRDSPKRSWCLAQLNHRGARAYILIVVPKQFVMSRSKGLSADLAIASVTKSKTACRTGRWAFRAFACVLVAKLPKSTRSGTRVPIPTLMRAHERAHKEIYDSCRAFIAGNSRLQIRRVDYDRVLLFADLPFKRDSMKSHHYVTLVVHVARDR